MTYYELMYALLDDYVKCHTLSQVSWNRQMLCDEYALLGSQIQCSDNNYYESTILPSMNSVN